MIPKTTIQPYINNFRRRLAPVLKPGVGLTCVVHPAISGGAILEFRISLGIENDDIYEEPTNSVGAALSQIPQRAFGGNLEGFRFGGTNVILEADKLILIKDESPAEWTDAAAKNDVGNIIQASKKGL